MAGNPAEIPENPEKERLAAHKTLAADMRQAAELAADPDRQGLQAYLVLSQMQVLLGENGLSLADDYGYTLAGFPNRAKYEAAVRRQAGITAIQQFQLAQEYKDFIATADTIDQHPYYGMDLAWDMICITGKPLFADTTYAPLGLTRDEFMGHIRAAHIDCASQKLRIAAEEIMHGHFTKAGHAMFRDVRERHLKALGVDSIDDSVGDALRFTPHAIDVMETQYAQWEFREALKATLAEKISDYDIDYAMGIVEIWDLLNTYEGLRDDPGTFEDTGFNKDTLYEELIRCCDVVLRHYLQAVNVKSNPIEMYKNLIDHLHRLREVVGEYEVDEDLVDPGEDYWYQDVCREFGVSSFAKFLADAHAVRAAALASITMMTSRSEQGTKLEKFADYEHLNTALQHFGKAYILLDDTAALARLGVNAEAFKDLMAKTAGTYINDKWDQAFLVGASTQQKLDLFPDLYDASLHIRGTDAEAELAFSRMAVVTREHKLLHRRAEELLAGTLICLPGRFGVYDAIEEAFDYIDQTEIDIFNERLRRGMNLSMERARQFDLQKDVLGMVRQWRNALDEDSGNVPSRFSWMTDVYTRLEDFEEDGREEAIALFLQHADAAGMQDIHDRHVALARDLVAESLLQLSDEDLDLAYQHQKAQDLLNAVSVINPEDPDNAFVFKRITGLDYDAFSQKFQTLETKKDDALTRVYVAFDAAGRAPDILKQARDPKNAGEVAFQLMESLAYQLRRDGKSILDPSILKPAGMRPQDIKDFMEANALEAARGCAGRARAKAGFVVTLQNWRDHPFGELQGVFGWIMRTPHFSLADEPYQAAGYTGRQEFAGLMREALLDLLVQMEQAALKEGASQGARQYLKALDEIRHASRALGLEEKEDILRFSSFTHVRAGQIAIDTTQRAIIGMGKTAISNVIVDSKPYRADPKHPDFSKYARPLSYQYKGMMAIMDFARDMCTTDWAMLDPSEYATLTLNSIVSGRVEQVLARYMKNPGQPSRGIRLVVALEKLNGSHELEKTSWFNELFEQYGYTSYRAFVEMTAESRIVQLVKRTNRLIETISPEDAGKDQGLHLTIARDLRRIQSVVKAGFLTEAQKQGILNRLGVEQDWVETTISLNAAMSLPLLVLQAQDPTLHDQHRIFILQELEFFMDMVGPEGLKRINIRPQMLARLKDKSYARIASHQLFDDLIRGTPQSIREATIEAHQTLTLIAENAAPTDGPQATESRFKDRELMTALGLSEQEADAYAALADYLFPYQCLRQLEEHQPEEINVLYSLLYTMYDHAQYKKIDYTSGNTLKRLGVPSPEEFRERVDERILEILSIFSGAMMQPVEDAQDLRATWNSMTGLMNISGIEKRATSAQWRTYEIISRTDMNNLMMATYMRCMPRSTSPEKFMARPTEILVAGNLNLRP